MFAASIASGAGVWSYYGAWPVPYTPSYNLLTLLCALLALALALRLGRAILLGEGRLGIDAFLLGVVASVGIASKFTSGVLVLAVCLAIIGALGSLDLQFPAVDDAKKAELTAARAALEQE